MGNGKVIGNVGILDLRNATEESIAAIGRIGNVGVIFISPETAALVARINAGNVGTVMEAPGDARAINGQEVVGRGYFKAAATPMHLVVNGQIVFEPDVVAEDIEKGLGSLTVNGRLVYPRHLMGVLQPRIRHINGSSWSYAPSDRLATGRLTLDENYLQALSDATKLAVAGRLDLPRVLPNDLVKQRIQSLQVIGRIRLHEENAEAIYALLDRSAGDIGIKIIPAGFELVDTPLVLDDAVLESLPASKLYCTERIVISPDVDPAILDSRLEALATEDMVVCPAALRQAISRKLHMLDTRAVFYEGELWLVEDEMELVPSRFEFSEGKVTLVVTGELTVAPDVEPRVLAERLFRVHNLGEIYCTREQMGAIQARLGISDGNLLDSAKPDAGEGGNVGYLVL